MGLPDLIEIIPPSELGFGEVSIPGSKSITNRALVLAALAQGESVLQGALWSEDTQVMVEALQRLGFLVEVSPDPEEGSNRTIRVQGSAGEVGEGGTDGNPLELSVGNAGTAARFLSALVCLGKGVYRLSGVPRMHERPQAALFEALRQLGYRIEASQNRLPARIYGSGPRPGACQVSIAESSQFASALLLSARTGGWQVEVLGHHVEESPYIEMTRKLLVRFPQQGGSFPIEPDASSGSYFIAANTLLGANLPLRLAVIPDAQGGKRRIFERPEVVRVKGWPATDWQVDAAFPRFLPLPLEISRDRDLGDSIMTAVVLAPFAEHPVRFTDLGRLRVQECERVAALRSELDKCGARVVEEGDTLTVYPSKLHGAEVTTYSDHRMAMCFAILGLKVPGIKINNPACVKKTFPNFFQKLADPPPRGLGVQIVEGLTGRELRGVELITE